MASLPPTSAAAQQHLYRVYLWVQQWLGHSLPPSEWGWKRDEHTLVAVATDEPAAPQTLLKLVSCACKSGCGNACGCRKRRLVCSFLSLGVLKYVVCLCRGCDGCCVFVCIVRSAFCLPHHVAVSAFMIYVRILRCCGCVCCM